MSNLYTIMLNELIEKNEKTVRMHDTTEHMIHRLREGDNDAFRQIINQYGGFVYNVAYRMFAHHYEAEEVTQDVFLTVFKKIRDFETRSSIKTWLYRITVNRALTYAKRKKKERELQNEFGAVLAREESPSALKATIDAEHTDYMMQRLLGCLNVDQRICMVLRTTEGLSYEEIAEALEININTVRSRLKRAREKMLAYSRELKRHEL